MVYLFAKWAYVCVTMVLKNRVIVLNFVVLLLLVKMVVPAKSLVLTQNMAEPFTFFKKTILDFFAYRQEIVRNGNRNTTNELRSNVQTYEKK